MRVLSLAAAALITLPCFAIPLVEDASGVNNASIPSDNTIIRNNTTEDAHRSLTEWPRRRYQITGSIRGRTNSITLNYLRGFFDKIVRTVIQKAIDKYSPGYIPIPQTWDFRTMDPWVSNKVLFKAQLHARIARRPMRIDLIRDIFQNLPYFLAIDPLYDDESFSYLDVTVLEDFNGDKELVAELSIWVWGKLGNWIDGERIIVNRFGAVPDLIDSGNVTEISKW